jgi:hypothetical protein
MGLDGRLTCTRGCSERAAPHYLSPRGADFMRQKIHIIQRTQNEWRNNYEIYYAQDTGKHTHHPTPTPTP